LADKEISERGSTETLLLHLGQITENACPLGTFWLGI
jgi:hypothetical protein